MNELKMNGWLLAVFFYSQSGSPSAFYLYKVRGIICDLSYVVVSGKYLLPSAHPCYISSILCTHLLWRRVPIVAEYHAIHLCWTHSLIDCFVKGACFVQIVWRSTLVKVIDSRARIFYKC